MNPIEFALLVAALVFALIMVVYTVVRLFVDRHRAITERMNRWASIYKLQRAPGESNRRLSRRIHDRTIGVYRGPYQRRR